MKFENGSEQYFWAKCVRSGVAVAQADELLAAFRARGAQDWPNPDAKELMELQRKGLELMKGQPDSSADTD